MKLLRNIVVIVSLFLVVDIARYLVYPDVGRLVTENPSTTAFMEYREEQWKSEGLDDRKIRQRWVPLDRVSPNLVKAVLIAEDNKFWEHKGFDYEAIEKAIEKNIEAKKFESGASTISQQLAKNLFLSPSKNPVRKIKEAILTWRIEKSLTKRRILELYVNVAEWGDGIFGIEAAARHYFGVSAAGLSAQQASRLAAVLPNPLEYSPVNPSRYVRSRALHIYAIMRKRGIVVPDYQEVMAPPPDTTKVDSVVVGVPDYLIEQAESSDSTGMRAPEEGKPSPGGGGVGESEGSGEPVRDDASNP
ncbi:MAG: monofunctional biosynthetic peptidoglycan transglycosylase [Chlorobium sp.]|uniref:monofunctional biosynthetic peptidoglycan transglycosylase n=1 Tax=Chlorobium sp. TaxID=1095 RepID=UPI0025C5E4D2|nr:monofunctional biosynthetic peptidoglycan transglycosylase [Chlorobium sp.]MCF8383249.1 monofunctional biosynthetic peptidoglycan transglycosylase [Chlorobium sp.]